MKKEQLAELLNDIDLDDLVSKETEQQAKESGLVIVYGCSDDLCEFAGAIQDEADCYEGGLIFICKKGLIPDCEEMEGESEKFVMEYFNAKKESKQIAANWCEVEPYSWTYETEIPHATFNVKDKNNDDEHYCRGIVFEISSLG